MAKCDMGYLCDVCGDDVAAITESDLYLRYVLGEVSPLALPTLRERHLRCNPTTAQYIVAADFPPVACDGIFAKANLDADYVRQQETRVTRAWQHLQALPHLGLPITEYPLPEVRERWQREQSR